MREIRSGEYRGWWWRITRRTHGVAIGLHWPSRQLNQWQTSLLIFDVTWGRA